MTRTTGAIALLLVASVLVWACNPRLSNGLRKKDRGKDVQMVTTMGTIVLRLSDSTPMHRDNFLMLVKRGYYDSLLFHRVIRGFMIQSGDPDSKDGHPGKPLSQGGSGGPGYTVPPEFRPALFHKRGALAAARTGGRRQPFKGEQREPVLYRARKGIYRGWPGFRRNLPHEGP